MSHRTVRILLCAAIMASSLPLRAQPTLRPPMPKLALPVQEKVDLTTPAATIRSFGAATNRYNFAEMAQCVADINKGDSQQATAIIDQFKTVKAQMSLSEPRVRVQGNLALASLFSQMKLQFTNKPPVEQPAQPERVLLRLAEGQWKIVPNVEMLTQPGQQAGLGPAPGMEKGEGFLTMVATYVSNPEIIRKFAEAAQQASCADNLKQLAVAVMQLTQDFNDVYAFTAAAQKTTAPGAENATAVPPILDKPWQKALWNYTKSPRIFFCPIRTEIKPGDEAKLNEQARRDKLMDDAGIPRAGAPYALNENLEGLKQKVVLKPAETVLFYEGSGGKLDFRHEGKAYIAFCDGHVATVGPEDTIKLIWNPQVPGAPVQAEK